MTSILNREFRYVPAAATDIRKTFARVRREQREAEARRAAPTPTTVRPLRRATGDKS